MAATLNAVFAQCVRIRSAVLAPFQRPCDSGCEPFVVSLTERKFSFETRRSLMKQHVVIFEARGGSDKGEYGYRPDSKPIIDSLTNRGWTSEVIFYRDEDRGEIYRHTCERAGRTLVA